jgi:hypothetical protein
MKIDYDRAHRTMSLSMPGYVDAALKRFGTPTQTKPTISPAIYTSPDYTKPDFEIMDDDSPPISEGDAKFIQEVIGVFLYYARAIDSTMFTQLNKMASQQSKPTQRLLNNIHHFLQYAATFPASQLIFRQSNMQLIIESDGSYLSESNSRSRAAGVHYFRSSTTPADLTHISIVHVVSSIIPSVLASAMETEYASMFMNDAQKATSMRTTLSELGYPQLKTPIYTDNTAAAGIVTRRTKQRKSKAIAMRFHWLRDRVDQGEFDIIWAPGLTNLADFYSKTLPASDFFRRRDHYVHTPPTTNSNWIGILKKFKSPKKGNAGILPSSAQRQYFRSQTL